MRTNGRTARSDCCTGTGATEKSCVRPSGQTDASGQVHEELAVPSYRRRFFRNVPSLKQSGRRCGTVNLFVFMDAHRPWRRVKVTDRRTRQDFGECMRELVDVDYPDAPIIRVVVDNLSTHSTGALYDAFPAPQARMVLKRLKFHYTPKHAS